MTWGRDARSVDANTPRLRDRTKNVLPRTAEYFNSNFGGGLNRPPLGTKGLGRAQTDNSAQTTSIALLRGKRSPTLSRLEVTAMPQIPLKSAEVRITVPELNRVIGVLQCSYDVDIRSDQEGYWTVHFTIEDKRYGLATVRGGIGRWRQRESTLLFLQDQCHQCRRMRLHTALWTLSSDDQSLERPHRPDLRDTPQRARDKHSQHTAQYEDQGDAQ